MDNEHVHRGRLQRRGKSQERLSREARCKQQVKERRKRRRKTAMIRCENTRRIGRFAVGCLALAGICALATVSTSAQRGGRGGGPPQPPKAISLIDVTGYWVSIVDEDWRWRMMTPAKGDYASIPLNAEGTKIADTWDPAKDEAEGNQCKAYGAAGIM